MQRPPVITLVSSMATAFTTITPESDLCLDTSTSYLCLENESESSKLVVSKNLNTISNSKKFDMNEVSSEASTTKREKKRNAQKYLASQYSPNKQKIDLVVAFFYGVFVFRLLFTVFTKMTSISSIFSLVIAITSSAFIADLISGLVHWACDTWGTLDTPIFGRNLIRSFREHHVDPTAITRHPFPETNGNLMITTLPWILLLNFVNFEGNDTTMLTLCLLPLWVSFTNQIHKWAHTYQPPWIISKLQKYHMILPSKQHNFHHFSPYDRDYCITTGWLNPIFQTFDLWKKMESVIVKWTGATPREDDMLWTLQDKSSDVLKKE